MTNFNKRITNFACIITSLVMSAGCDWFKTELDIDAASFPPKLCVTAILDGGNGSFSIVISEGRALADYKTPRLPETENKRNGEIRLYEDDRLILSEAGEFDLAHSYAKEGSYGGGSGYMYIGNGHCFETSVATHPGSAYRLVVEVDGYKTATSTSVMPLLPDASASMDTTVIIKKSGAKKYITLNGGSSGTMHEDFDFWPVSLHLEARATGRNYYVLEMLDEMTLIEGTLPPWLSEGIHNTGVYVSDLTKLQDNPEVEIFENQEIDLDPGSRDYDTYWFTILLMSDVGFTEDNASQTLYTPIVPKYLLNLRSNYDPERDELVLLHHKSTLRVRHITEATFRYYRSLAMQGGGLDFFTEPVNIMGNIENGYGGFTVFSATDIQLLEYKIYYIYSKRDYVMVSD